MEFSSLPPLVSRSSAHFSQLISQIGQNWPKSGWHEEHSEVLNEVRIDWADSLLIKLNQRKKYKLALLLSEFFSSVKNHNVSGPHLFPSFTTHAKEIPLPPLGRSYSEYKNHFAIGRNSERCSYHTDLSRFVLLISDPSALNFSQFVGFQNSPNRAKSKKLRKRVNLTEKSYCSSKEP